LEKLPESRNRPTTSAVKKDWKNWKNKDKKIYTLGIEDMALVTSNQTSPFEEVVPASVAVKGVSRSSILTQRRRVRVPPQSGTRYGSGGSGAAGNQIQFLIADAGGLLDPASVSLVYNVQTNSSNVAMDDGHPFNRVQINLNGQNLEDIVQAARVTNAEVKLNASTAWLRSAGSFCGFELLNNELLVGDGATPTTVADILAYSGAFGDVVNNLPTVAGRQQQLAYAWNPYGGSQRLMPLGLMSGLGRTRMYLPLNVLGELNITCFTAPANEACVVAAAQSTTPDYSLAGVFLEYDIVVPIPQYAELLHKIANDPMEAGLMIPFESTITATGGAIAASASSLAETSIVVSRATQNLIRSYLIQQPSALITNINYPSYSAFSHGGAYSIQWRIGSTYHPSIPAEGDASMYAMSQLAYGTAGRNDAAGLANRALWGQNTSTVTGNAMVARTNEGAFKFCGADSFTPAYGFQCVKGEAEALDVDGISLSGASGAQAVLVLRSAPDVPMTPFVALVALRFINAHAGAVRVIGA
jgi:hypothetical protein